MLYRWAGPLGGWVLQKPVFYDTFVDGDELRSPRIVVKFGSIRKIIRKAVLNVCRFQGAVVGVVYCGGRYMVVCPQRL